MVRRFVVKMSEIRKSRFTNQRKKNTMVLKIMFCVLNRNSWRLPRIFIWKTCYYKKGRKMEKEDAGLCTREHALFTEKNAKIIVRKLA